ncbi:hypothetical protein GCM10012275_56310 [Longimycelium tulufanense]|uniref:Uncharacterized protein n=1 Tax=Longimycelium tulufanense TaxID=907463 RepID=A0A8J3CJX1_9PSEU|nr:hypothetical protein [Longimycelium tulufanense]GGM78435.1 hypothetical protein GCM10012275_56310 [Longimycelium tulufanense]
MWTTIAAVKSALHKKIRDLELPDVQVLYGDRVDRKRASVWLGATELSDSEPTAFRGGARVRRNEDYIVHVHAEVLGNDVERTERRCIEIVGRIEEALAADPTLGHAVPGVKSVTMSSLRLNTNETDTGPIAHAELGLRVKASLA